MTADLYLNGTLINDVLQYTYKFPIIFEGELIDLQENTNYDVRVVVNAANNSREIEFSFLTLGDTYDGDLSFRYQSEVDEFAQNQYQKIIGDIEIILPGNTCHPEDIGNHCSYNITNLSGFDSILEIDGDLRVNTWQFATIDTGAAVTGINNLKNITGDLIISAIDVSNLFGSINHVGKDFKILYGRNFTTLNIFLNLDFIGGDIEIDGNVELIDFCSIQQTITGDLNGSYKVNDNGYNPTVDDIVSGNCSI